MEIKKTLLFVKVLTEIDIMHSCVPDLRDEYMKELAPSEKRNRKDLKKIITAEIPKRTTNTRL